MTGFSASVAQRLDILVKWIITPILNRVRCVLLTGLTPQKLALTLCIGCALGTLPLVWGTSLICILIANLFRLNCIVLQSINYLLYPLQLTLLIPFFELGARLLTGGPQISSNILSALFRNPGISSLNVLGWITLKSLAAWMVTVIPLALLVYVILLAITKRKNSMRTVTTINKPCI